MELKLTIKNQLIDAIPLKPERCKEVQYVDAVKRLLKIRHGDKLKKAGSAGTFFIDIPSSFYGNS